MVIFYSLPSATAGGSAGSPRLLGVRTWCPLGTAQTQGGQKQGHGGDEEAQQVPAPLLPVCLLLTTKSPWVPAPHKINSCPQGINISGGCQNHETWGIHKSPSIVPVPGKQALFHHRDTHKLKLCGKWAKALFAEWLLYCLSTTPAQPALGQDGGAQCGTEQQQKKARGPLAKLNAREGVRHGHTPCFCNYTSSLMHISLGLHRSTATRV